MERLNTFRLTPPGPSGRVNPVAGNRNQAKCPKID